MPDLASAVAAALAELAPPGVRTGCRAVVAADEEALHAVERAAIARAVPSRRHEFASGRALLRQLLGTDVAIGVGPDRRPHLPAGVVASLAHAGSLAVAAVCADDVATTLGVDVEPATELEAELGPIILREDEAGLDAHLAFTLKEAVYKAWSNRGGRLLDHHDVRLSLRAAGEFEGVELTSGTVLRGRYTQAADHWLALVVVPPAATRPAAS